MSTKFGHACLFAARLLAGCAARVEQMISPVVCNYLGVLKVEAE